MRNWLIAMAVSGTLTGLSHTASAQEIKRTGGGSAKSECFASWGSCGGLGPEICSGPDCNVSVSGNGTIFPGFDGKASLNMSAMSIQVSGEASFTPPSPCSESTFTGGPVYIANGSQSIYADVPNETPIRITITSSLSGTDGGWATWSTAKSGAGGASGTTVFDTKAGPGKITDSGVDYYLIDTIGAQGNAGASRKCDEPNDQSFNGSLSMSFCVAAGKMKAASSTELTALVDTPVELKVQVNNGCTNAPLAGQSISFSGVDPAGGQNFSLQSSTQTDADGFATVSFTPGSTPGDYSISAFCSACGADRQVTFTVTALTKKQATELSAFDCGGSGFLSDSLPGGIRVRAINSVTGKPVSGFSVQFLLLSSPGGTGISLTPGPVSTDGNGIARASLAFGDIQGEYTVIATCQDCEGNQQVTCRPLAIPKPDLPAPATHIDVQRLKNEGIIVSVSPPSVSPQKTDGNHTANISIQGMPQMGFTATVSAIQFTGGHQHDIAGRPLGTLSAESGLTDASGNATLAYTAGEVGGLEMISIRMDDEARADVVVTVTVDPGLQRLPASPSYLTNSNDKTHPNFVYGGSVLLQQVPIIASAYTTAFSTNGITPLISVNDMSLINGGAFDVEGSWGNPHNCHRIGASVDLNRGEIRNGRLVPVANMATRISTLLSNNPGIECRRVVEKFFNKKTGRTTCNIHLECPKTTTCTSSVPSCTED